MSDSRARAGNNKMSLEIQKVKKHSDYCEDMPKGHKSPLNGAPISQSWDDLSIKINNDADYNPSGKKIKIHVKFIRSVISDSLQPHEPDRKSVV